MNEANEIFFEFYENKGELINSAEKIITEMEILFDNLPDNLMQMTYFDIETNFDLFNNNYNNFCKIVENITIKDEGTINNIKTEKNEDLVILKTSPSNITIPSKFNEESLASTNNILTTEEDTNNKLDNSFSSLIEENLILFNNKRKKEMQLLTESSSSEKTCINTTFNTERTMPSDKIVFIKNQLNNECANFTGYSIGDEGAKIISELLLASQFAISQHKKQMSQKIKEIKLSRSSITELGLGYIISALEKNTSINTLNLSKNKLKDDSYSKVLSLIKKNKSLKVLNLTSNNFSQNIKDKIKINSKSINPNLRLDL